MKSAGKARSNGLYRHIRTSKEIIRNLLNDYCNINETKENNMKYKTAQDLVSREYIFIKKENVSWQTESY